MEEVDYTKFLYKRESEKKADIPPARPYKTKSGCGTKVFVILIIVVCFSLLLLAVDIVSDGKVVSAISDRITGGYDFYLVGVDGKSPSDLYEKSLSVKIGGGGGYILDGAVIYSVYADREVADRVAKKNGATVNEINISTTKRNKIMKKGLDILIATVTDYDEGDISDGDFYRRMGEIKSILSELPSDDSMRSYLFDGLTDIAIPHGVKTEFLSSARYFLIGWVSSL